MICFFSAWSIGIDAGTSLQPAPKGATWAACLPCSDTPSVYMRSEQTSCAGYVRDNGAKAREKCSGFFSQETLCQRSCYEAGWGSVQCCEASATDAEPSRQQAPGGGGGVRKEDARYRRALWERSTSPKSVTERKQPGMFMPASNTLFCICYKCGTTSLYQ